MHFLFHQIPRGYPISSDKFLPLMAVENEVGAEDVKKENYKDSCNLSTMIFSFFSFNFGSVL